MDLIVIRKKPIYYFLLILSILFVVFSIFTNIDNIKLLFELILLIICPLIILISGFLLFDNFKREKIRAHYFLLSLLIIIQLTVTGQIVIRIFNQ